MNRKTFNAVIAKLPHLTAQGLMDITDASFLRKRYDFVRGALYLQQVNDAVYFLSRIGKSTRFSKWQRSHCTPENLSALIEWSSGRNTTPGAIIVAALHLGFTMGVNEGIQTYFNFQANQIENELNHLAQVRSIQRSIQRA